MSKKEMSRKLCEIGALALILMIVCTIVLCVGVFISLYYDIECITVMIVSTALWLTGFTTLNILSNNKTEDI